MRDHALMTEAWCLSLLSQFVKEINHKKSGGATALYLASQNGHHEVVSYLLGFGARALVMEMTAQGKPEIV